MANFFSAEYFAALYFKAMGGQETDADPNALSGSFAGSSSFSGELTATVTTLADDGSPAQRPARPEEIKKYREQRERAERALREHADRLAGYVEPAEPQEVAAPEPTLARTAFPNLVWPRQVAPAKPAASPAYNRAYAEQQAELLRLEIERVTQAIAAAEAELALANIEAERAAFMLRDEDDVMVLLLAA